MRLAAATVASAAAFLIHPVEGFFDGLLAEGFGKQSDRSDSAKKTFS